ncbi:MAG: hypothetical protein J0I20_22725 [Chloroflexi bacterium]|nr:hypothetical protein [Chloroflexota bacterium]
MVLKVFILTASLGLLLTYSFKLPLALALALPQAQALTTPVSKTDGVGSTPSGGNPPGSTQQVPGRITGRVVNGTAGAGLAGAGLNPSGQVVKLERFSGSDTSPSDTAETTLDPAWNFAFQNLTTGDNVTYYLSTRYAGVTYYLPQSLTLTASQPIQAVELKVYEPSTDQSLISIAGTSVIVPQVDPDSGQIFILEMYSIVNKGDRTFTGASSKPTSGVGSPGGAGTTGQNQLPAQSPAGEAATIPTSPAATTPDSANPDTGSANSVTLRFFLPAGAKGISPAAGLNPDDIIETTDGLEVTAPILPGETQMVFSYILPYQADTFSFSKRLAYDTPSFRFFTPVSGPSATSPQLRSGQIIEMGQQKLVPLSGQDFKADTQLKIELTGLTPPASKGTTLFRDNFLKVGTLITILVGLGFLVGYVRNGRKVKTASPVPGIPGSSPTQATPAPQTGPAAIQYDPNPSPGPRAGVGVSAGTVAGPTGSHQLERQLMLGKIAQLDLDFQKGGFKGKETFYDTKRANLKDRLLEIWESQRPTPETGPASSGMMGAAPDPGPGAGVTLSPADPAKPPSVETGAKEKNV